MDIEKNDMQELISIIVPVYNVEDYLTKCVQSIRNQTYPNLEIILVDDGSTDHSGEMCDSLALLDHRISVYHKANGGLSDARNCGIDHAAGRYIGFVDSDDYVDRSMFENLYHHMKVCGADISACGYRMIYQDKSVDICEGDSLQQYTDEEAFEVLFDRDNLGVLAWNKLFSKELFDGIRFPVGQHFEDINTIYKLVARVKKIVYDPAPYYFYLQRENSINGENFKNKVFNPKLYDMESAADEVLLFTEKKYPGATPYIAIGVCGYYLRIINQEIQYGKSKKSLGEKSKLLIKQNAARIIKHPKLAFTRKVQMLLYAYFPKLYVSLIKALYLIKKHGR